MRKIILLTTCFIVIGFAISCGKGFENPPINSTPTNYNRNTNRDIPNINVNRNTNTVNKQ